MFKFGDLSVALRRFGWFFWFASLAATATERSAEAAVFRASVVKIDITPDKPQWLLGYDPRQSTGVLDHLFHRIVGMDDGTTQFFLISSDLCLISPSVYDQVTRAIKEQTGIGPLQIWWTTTHTHSAPEVGPPGLAGVFMGARYEHEHNVQYSARVEQALIQGIKEARAKLAPARLGVGWGMAMANINRRARDVTGPAFLGLNPDGPTDRLIGLIRLENADGHILALIANYAMHGTVLSGKNLLISGEAPGTVAEYVERKLDAPTLYINGATGDLAPIYTVYPDPESGHLSQFRVLLVQLAPQNVHKMVKFWKPSFVHLATGRYEAPSLLLGDFNSRNLFGTTCLFFS
jgi:neutral ceramidase